MLNYKIDVADALKRANFNTYKAKTSGILSQDTLKKLKNEDTKKKKRNILYNIILSKGNR